MGQRDEISRDSGVTRRLEAPAAAATATPRLDAVDFVSEERPLDGYIVLSLSRRTRTQRDASLRDPSERSAD